MHEVSHSNDDSGVAQRSVRPRLPPSPQDSHVLSIVPPSRVRYRTVLCRPRMRRAFRIALWAALVAGLLATGPLRIATASTPMLLALAAISALVSAAYLLKGLVLLRKEQPISVQVRHDSMFGGPPVIYAQWPPPNNSPERTREP